MLQKPSSTTTMEHIRVSPHAPFHWFPSRDFSRCLRRARVSLFCIRGGRGELMYAKLRIIPCFRCASWSVFQFRCCRDSPGRKGVVNWSSWRDFVPGSSPNKLLKASSFGVLSFLLNANGTTSVDMLNNIVKTSLLAWKPTYTVHAIPIADFSALTMIYSKTWTKSFSERSFISAPNPLIENPEVWWASPRHLSFKSRRLQSWT